MKHYFDATKVGEITTVIFDSKEIKVKLVEISRGKTTSFIYESLQTKRILLQRDSELEELSYDDFDSVEEAKRAIEREDSEVSDYHSWQESECWKNFLNAEREVVKARDNELMNDYLEEFREGMSDLEE